MHAHTHRFTSSKRTAVCGYEYIVTFPPALIVSDPPEMGCASISHSSLIIILVRDVFGMFNLNHPFWKM